MVHLQREKAFWNRISEGVGGGVIQFSHHREITDIITGKKKQKEKTKRLHFFSKEDS